MNSLRKIFGTAVLVSGILFWASAGLSHAAAKADWQGEWDKAVQAAKEEGQITIYHTRGPFDKLFVEFQKRYPAVKIATVVGRGGELITRIMAEMRAGKNLADLYLGSYGTPLDVLYPAKALEPIPPLLILPEVRDPSLWFQKQHHYADPESRFIYVYEGVVRSDMAYNFTLADRKEFGSYWDLVKPKWKGKIAAMDPKLPGFPTGLLQFAYYHPDLGPKFVRALFGGMDVTLSRDGRQLVDWLGVGKFAIALGPSATDVQAAMKQKLPVERFEPHAFKEGIYMRATQGSLNVLARGPHPNASKVFANWLLSREGQIHYQREFLRIDTVFSLRDDVPVDPAVAPFRPKPNDNFMPIYRWEYRELQSAYKLIDEAMKK